MNTDLQSSKAGTNDEVLFTALAKWEQNLFTHSFGTLTVTNSSVSFMPGKVSVLGKEFSIPIKLITSVTKRDNFLWRGALNLYLAEEFEGRSKFIFFLGGQYRTLLQLLNGMDKNQQISK